MDSADFDMEVEALDADVDVEDDDSDVRKLPDGTEVSKRQPKYFVGGALRDYQLDGMEWLTALYDNGLCSFIRVVFTVLILTLAVRVKWNSRR